MASDDDNLYSSDEESQPVVKKQKVETKEDESDKKEAESEDNSESGEESEEESDDDIEFVIGDSAVKTQASTATSTGALNDTVDAVSDGIATEKTTGATSTTSKSTTTIDVNQVAELDGKPLTQVDLAKLKDKPWRFPGADITDYFNYGFDEFTWTAYCCKQDKLRGEFNPQKVMESIMGGAPPKNGGSSKSPPMGMPMPPNFPGMMPMGMPPMGMPPNFPGMPPNFNGKR